MNFQNYGTFLFLSNGQAVAVRQPLPLPKGVSDYAVGRGMAVQKAMSPLAALRSMAIESKQVREEECKDELSKLTHVSVELTEISATRGLSKEDIQRVIKQQIPCIEICYQKALEKKPNIQGEATFQLLIDSKGKVTKVSLVSSKLNDKNLEKCIIQKIKELTFPPLEGKDRATVNVSFTLRTS
jgi:Ca-activated chloride channel family protein